MPASDFVRAARLEDVDRVVAIQVAAWRVAYSPALSEAVLEELASEEAAKQFREQWHDAVASPPSSRHRLLVATSEREVVGFASLGPARDPDRWPGTDAEIYALYVDPERAGQGHGSRLLNAAVDHLVDDGFRAAHVWVMERGDPLRRFLEASGWRADGARRELDAGAAVPMARLHAGIGEQAGGAAAGT